MASVFKRGRDKDKRNSHWYISYNDHTGKRRTKKGYTDKGLTEQLAAKIEQEVMLRRRGLIDPEDERRLKTKSSPIEEHLDSFQESLGENTSKHVKLTMSRIRRVIKEASVTNLGSLRMDSVATALRKIKREDEIGNRTYNHYIQAIDSFCNWLVMMGRLDRNPSRLQVFLDHQPSLLLGKIRKERSVHLDIIKPYMQQINQFWMQWQYVFAAVLGAGGFDS